MIDPRRCLIDTPLLTHIANANKVTSSGVIAMPHARFSGEEIVRRGEEWYERSIQEQVETGDNIGKIVSIDIETGDYAVDDDPIGAGLRVQAIHPDAAIYGKRIGYNAAFTLGVTLT